MNRRKFLINTSLASAAFALPGRIRNLKSVAGTKMKLGLVTYLWGKDMDIPTLIHSCESSGLGAVELRVDHAHGVRLGMSAHELSEVRKQFEDSAVEVLGMGTNEEYDSPDPDVLKANMDRTREWIRLSHAIGGTGVKVKPNKFHKEVPQEKTLEQIGRSLDELGRYAADYDQLIRLEVHGHGTQELPNIKTIMDHAPHPNVVVCWNSNPEDLHGEGLEYNFYLVRDRLGDTVHVRELDSDDYPYDQLMNLFKEIDYEGWILLECRTDPDDKIAALKEQHQIFRSLIHP